MKISSEDKEIILNSTRSLLVSHYPEEVDAFDISGSILIDDLSNDQNIKPAIHRLPNNFHFDSQVALQFATIIFCIVKLYNTIKNENSAAVIDQDILDLFDKEKSIETPSDASLDAIKDILVQLKD